MERRSFITKLSVLAPAAFVAPNYLFASSGKTTKAETADVLVISMHRENSGLKTMVSEIQQQAVFLGNSERILKTERTEKGYQVFLADRTIEARLLIVDAPVKVNEATKKIHLEDSGNASLCFRNKHNQNGLFRAMNRSKMKAADLERVVQNRKPSLLLLS